MKFFILFLLLSTNAIAKEIKAPVNKTNQKQKTNAAELSLSNDSEDSELDIDEPEPKSVNIPPAREISGIGLGYFFNSKQKHSSISVNDIGTNYSGSLEYEWQSVPEIFAFTHKTPEFGWGYDFMFTYSPTKKLDKATVFLNGYGTFTSAGSSDVKTQSIIVQGNAVYSAGNIYFPFGLNLSANIYENSVSSTASVMSKFIDC